MPWIFKRNSPSKTKLSPSADNEASESDHLLVSTTSSIDNSSTYALPIDDTTSTLRPIPDKIPLVALNLVAVHFCERFAFYGLSGIFQNYLKNPLPSEGNGNSSPSKGSHAPGALGLGQDAATLWQNLFQVGVYRFFVKDGLY